MTILIAPPPPSTVTLYGDETSFTGGFLAGVSVRLRQLVGGRDTTPSPVTAGGPTIRVLADPFGHWTTAAIPGINLVPGGIVEIDSPTMGLYRLVVPLAPGNYEAITLRDNTK